MVKEHKISKTNSFTVMAWVIIFMFLNFVQCYGSEGESITDYTLISGKFIAFQNSMIIIMALIIVLLVSALAILVNKHIKLKKVYDELAAKDKVRSDYIIIISHELRTPLNIIINSARLLREYLKDEQMDKQYILDKSEYIVNNSSRLLRTINNSVDAAMIESGVASVNFENYNVVESIEDIITASQEYAQSHNISLIFDPQEEEIITAIDRCKIERAMLNLISNSIKNIHKEGNITVTCERRNDVVYIKVIDDGVGMSEFTQKHLFEKYYQSSSDVLNRMNEGCGLGMYITYNLIKIHGGDVTVASEINKGTAITISLPIRIVDKDSCDTVKNFECDAKERAKIEFSDIYR